MLVLIKCKNLGRILHTDLVMVFQRAGAAKQVVRYWLMS